jgi:hypothetical protein
MTLAVLIAASISTHARFHRLLPDPHILAVNTHFGGQWPHDDIDSRPELQEQTIQQIALAHPDTLLIFPESVIPSWNGMHETRWASVFAQLKRQRTGLLIGTTIPIPNTEANRNVLLSRGYSRMFYQAGWPPELASSRAMSSCLPETSRFNHHPLMVTRFRSPAIGPFYTYFAVFRRPMKSCK